MPSRKQAFIDHEYDCPHRNVMCLNDTICNKNVALSKLLLHQKDAHEAPIEENADFHQGNLLFNPEDFKPSKTWFTWVPTHFTLNGGKQFYSQCFRNPTSGLSFLWVYVIGTPKEEENYSYTFTVYNTNKVIFEC